MLRNQINKHIHSVRYRTKDPYHLAAKLVKKCIEKDRNITINNIYDHREGVTDLGAVRILHLRKEEWKDLHDILVNLPTSMQGITLVEKIAYVKPGTKFDEYIAEGRFIYDPRDKSKNEIDERKDTGYTSLHYIFNAPGIGFQHGAFFECQVRTLFEEGWGEIDHKMNYPEKANSIVRGYLSSLNATAHAANEIASNLDTLNHIPLLVHWEAELRLERSADRVFCITPALQWVKDNIDEWISHVKVSHGSFYYFVLDQSVLAESNCNIVRKRLETEGLMDSKVWVRSVANDKSIIPIIADTLLLEKAIDPRSPREECDFSVIGAPSQRPVSRDEHLDMLITDELALNRMRAYLDSLVIN